MPAKKKTNNNYVPSAEDIKRLRTQVSTRQPSATIGPKSSTARMVDQSKLADPYKGAPKSQKAYNAVTTAGKLAAETVALGAVGKAAKIAYKGSYLLGKTVVHASPVKGLKQITPQVGSRAKPTEKVVFGLNPKGVRPSNVPDIIGSYAKKAGTDGSYYVGKVQRKGLETNLKMPGGKQLHKNFITSPKPIKRLKEIPGNSPSLSKDISKTLTKKGVVDPKEKISTYKMKKSLKKNPL
jgi:hypothetical protein